MGLYKHYLLLLLDKLILLSRTDYRKHSYIPKTTADWNNLPQEVPSYFYNNNNEHLKRLGGAGIAQWLEHRTRDWKVAGSNPCWNGGRIFFSRVDFLCWLLFRYPFHPRVTTVARKKSRSFCQKCRWQVTAKHAYTLRIEPCFGIGHNLSLMCQMTSEDIKHQLNNIKVPNPHRP